MFKNKKCSDLGIMTTIILFLHFYKILIKWSNLVASEKNSNFNFEIFFTYPAKIWMLNCPLQGNVIKLYFRTFTTKEFLFPITEN